ncbi:uncharacterized protein B0P05DRAFT_344160 [Gilbertella persicaria]|uniref:uncharacterized protein n=1 Tax=Gilbertella persicaria TaxID=101096 RepID=UPI00221F1433|nr:uncharacterized protein B0P05DRAFT_344160 [Gilbertella persicaria]KAI8048054.1 hypothetical protein B0P05DRAFT_344160 [Gilbertella persicaria]
MSEQQENKAQNAFLNATPTLPSFSLPANLNSKLALNKKSSQERPRLSNLRSVWLSQQSLEEDAFAQDKYVDINLPSVTIDSIEAPLLIKEIAFLFTIAILLCFSQAIYSAATSGISLLTTASLGEWSLVMLWSLFDQHACYDYSLFFAVSACVFGIQNSRMTHMTSALLFFLVHRLFGHNQQLQTYIRQQRQEQQAVDQKAIDQALEIYTKRRAMFLTTVSQEIRDAALIVMATLEQFSPSSILSNTHELLSACSIAVPITSISAINTMVQQACHISSHLNLISRIIRETDTHHVIAEENQVRSLVRLDFDAGELIQSVSDALAGMSGKLGVHFVIYHTDNVLYYPNAVGDADGIKHALINVSHPL